MAKFELIYLLNPELEDKKITSIKEEVKKIVEKHEGKFGEETELGKRKLSYKIDNHHYALYLLQIIDTEPETIQDITKELNLNQDIIRISLMHEAKKATPVKKPSRDAEDAPKKEEESTATPATKKVIKKTEKKEESAKTPESTPEKSAKDKVEMEQKPKKDKTDLSDLDQKLDEILNEDII